jgi:fructose-1,6-bisphosphatase/inositol monophosphatase family enzyme
MAERGAHSARAAPPRRTAELRGVAHTRYLDAGRRDRVKAAAALFGELGAGSSCAGIDYAQVVDGDLDCVLFWRTLPWDHAPGTLLVTEAGGAARWPDGTDYGPAEMRTGLLIAADDRCWQVARALLLAP